MPQPLYSYAVDIGDDRSGEFINSAGYSDQQYSLSLPYLDNEDTAVDISHEEEDDLVAFHFHSVDASAAVAASLFPPSHVASTPDHERGGDGAFNEASESSSGGPDKDVGRTTEEAHNESNVCGGPMPDLVPVSTSHHNPLSFGDHAVPERPPTGCPPEAPLPALSNLVNNATGAVLPGSDPPHHDFDHQHHGLGQHLEQQLVRGDSEKDRSESGKPGEANDKAGSIHNA